MLHVLSFLFVQMYVREANDFTVNFFWAPNDHLFTQNKRMPFTTWAASLPFRAWKEVLLTLAVDKSIANWPLSQPTRRFASHLRSLWGILVVPAPFDLSMWALMRSIKTGHLLYVPLCPISRHMMLVSLKLKPEVDASELIVELFQDSILILGCWIC